MATRKVTLRGGSKQIIHDPYVGPDLNVGAINADQIEALKGSARHRDNMAQHRKTAMNNQTK